MFRFDVGGFRRGAQGLWSLGYYFGIWFTGKSVTRDGPYMNRSQRHL